MSAARVLKLGGSLLLLPDWPERLTSWLEAHPAPLNLLLVGGGQIVNAVRELDEQHGLSIPFAHWLCIDLLSATARIAGELLPGFPLLTTPAQLQQLVRDGRLVGPVGEEAGSQPSRPGPPAYIVDVSCFYRPPTQLSKPGDDIFSADCPLPESWDTTSDSLAAWLATLVAAAELVLFKSTAPSGQDQSPHAWKAQGIVDQAFADVLPPSVSVAIVNLLAAPKSSSAINSSESADGSESDRST